MSSPKQTRPPQGGARRWAVLGGGVLLLVALVLLIFRQAHSRLQPTSSATGPVRAALPRLGMEADAELYRSYAGSQSCRPCHQEAFDLWKTSHHALAERAVDFPLDQSAFVPPRVFKHGSQSSEARSIDGRFELVTTGADAVRKPFPLERVLGVEPLKQFVVAGTAGRFQIMELAADLNRGEWFDIFGNEDRQPGEWGHWTGRGMNWNSMCAACHNTRVRKNYQQATDSYRTVLAELGVSCEACHGPMAGHVRWRKEHPDQKSSAPTSNALGSKQMLSTCGSCHARRTELTGDFQPGDDFFDHHTLSIPDETELFYGDGQVREEDYEYSSFLGSRMHAAGVRCWDCHVPHSGKLRLANNDLCLRCHNGVTPPAPRIDAAAHSFHQPNQPGGRCVDCHMPQTVYMQRHARRDHGFTIPDPLLTREHGIPNACNRCHRERSVDWALQAVEKRYGARMERPTRARARAISEARAGRPSAVEALVRLSREEKIPLWRGSVADLLKRWCGEPVVRAALLERIADPDPLVRASAERALEPLAQSSDQDVRAGLQRLLTDPARVVRVQAAWNLRSTLDTNSTAGQELWHYLAHNIDQPSGLLQMGTYFYDRGDNQTALNCFERAVVWDANSAPLRASLAVSLSLAGNKEGAVKELEAACRLAPKESEYAFKFGLALSEAGRRSEAMEALEKAVQLEPQFGKAWYNLALASAAAAKPDRALEAFIRAESIDPASPRIPYARGTLLGQLGRIEEARAAARRALEIEPGYAEAIIFLQSLGKAATSNGPK